MKTCPKCGCETETLHEGYCITCYWENEEDILEHEMRFALWDAMTPEQKEKAIKYAIKSAI